MHGLIIQSANAPAMGIALQTRKGSHIANHHGIITLWDKVQFKDTQDAHPLGNPRSEATAIFNCHGMTFASRRTCVDDPLEIRKILEEDGYQEIAPENVLPGDIILYFGEKGDIDHSGVVIEVPNREADNFAIPKIISKWGKYKEFIHMANHCPYNYLSARYFRIMK